MDIIEEFTQLVLDNYGPDGIYPHFFDFELTIDQVETSVILVYDYFRNHDIEFDDWKWVDYWSPVDEVINFKRDVYEDMLKALAPILFNNEHSIPNELSRPLQFSAIKL